MADSKIINRLKKFFGVDYKPKAKDVSDMFQAIKKDGDFKSGKLSKMPFSSETKTLLEYWMTACHDNMESWKHRKDLYDDMQLLYYNSPMIARAMTLVVDEVIQADTNEQPIFVEAKRATKKKIMEFYDEIGLYNLIPALTFDIVQFGNAYLMPSFSENGIDEVVPINVYDVKDRLEFTPFEVNEKMKSGDTLFTKLQGIERVNQLIDMVNDKENITSRFRSYLFGYQVGDYVVPPWRLIHFRNLTNKSPFKPFGVPPFIHAMSPYRQYDAAMTFQVIARGLMYPRDKYEITTPQGDPTDKIGLAVEFLNELMNSGLNNSQKEMPGLNDIIITIADLFDYEQISPDIDLGKMGDLEMLRDDLINATFLPRNLIDPQDGGFGDSGVSLIQKWKPFARFVYRIQNLILQGITELTKIHLLHRPDFTEDDLNFILSMPYPESQVDRDLIDNQNDLLDLANNIIDTLQDRITGGETLPPEMVRDIYQQFLPYDDKRIELWIKDAEKLRPKDDEDDMDIDGGDTEYERFVASKARENWSLLEKHRGKIALKETIKDRIFEEKQKVLRQGILQEKHFYSSKNKSDSFATDHLKELDKRRIMVLKEQGIQKPSLTPEKAEEVKYVFRAKKKKEENVKHGRSSEYIFSFDNKDKKYGGQK